MPPHGPHCSLPRRCKCPHLQDSLGQSKGCGHSESHTCSTPHPKLGWPQLQTPFLSPRTNTSVKIGKAGLKGYTRGYPLCEISLGRDRQLWEIDFSVLGPGGVCGSLGPPAVRRKGLLTCQWAVHHHPCASVNWVGDLPAPHTGNSQGRQPGRPGSLVYAEMRDALQSGSHWTVRGSAQLLASWATPAPITPECRVPTQDHEFSCPTFSLSSHVGGHTHIHPSITLECV